MKNVAKCDTWCELQNPVNHRVFERKLRPKPSGRGHVCLGVTHRVAPSKSLWTCERGGKWSPVCICARGWPKYDPTSMDVTNSGGCILNLAIVCHYIGRQASSYTNGAFGCLRPRPQVRRDYPLSLSISISGGKETYKDSPSNGERTGNSPT